MGLPLVSGHPFIPGLQGLGRALIFLLNLSNASRSLGSTAARTPPFFLHLAKASIVKISYKAVVLLAAQNPI